MEMHKSHYLSEFIDILNMFKTHLKNLSAKMPHPVAGWPKRPWAQSISLIPNGYLFIYL
jgi:hypothetical protein